MKAIDNVMIKIFSSIPFEGKEIQGCWYCPLRKMGCLIWFHDPDIRVCRYRFNHGNCSEIDNENIFNEEKIKDNFKKDKYFYGKGSC